MNAGDPMASLPTQAQPDAAPVLRVLVADDVQVNRELLRLLLRHYGHAVEEAGDGDEAVALVAAGGIDLVLLDIEMPGTNGLEALRRIRKLPHALGRTLVWTVTGHAYASDVEASHVAGANGHLSKPVCFQALQDVLRQAQQRCGTS